MTTLAALREARDFIRAWTRQMDFGADPLAKLDAAISAEEADIETREALDRACLEVFEAHEATGYLAINAQAGARNTTIFHACARGRFLASRGEGGAV